MADSSPSAWTDHDVSDPGVTLLQALAYALGAVAFVGVSVALVRRRRRSSRLGVATASTALGAILVKLKALVRPLLERVLR